MTLSIWSELPPVPLLVTLVARLSPLVFSLFPYFVLLQDLVDIFCNCVSNCPKETGQPKKLFYHCGSKLFSIQKLGQHERRKQSSWRNNFQWGLMFMMPSIYLPIVNVDRLSHCRWRNVKLIWYFSSHCQLWATITNWNWNFSLCFGNFDLYIHRKSVFLKT